MNSEKGICEFCDDGKEENLVNLFGIKVCEGCYHDILNHMSYKNLDHLLDCDKKQLSKFLNKLALKERLKNEKKKSKS